MELKFEESTETDNTFGQAKRIGWILIQKNGVPVGRIRCGSLQEVEIEVRAVVPGISGF
jgi:hypothetical protein